MSHGFDRAPNPGTVSTFTAPPSELFPKGVEILGDTNPMEVEWLRKIVQNDLVERGITIPSGQIAMAPTYWIVGGEHRIEAVQLIQGAVDDVGRADPQNLGGCLIRGYVGTTNMPSNPAELQPTLTLCLISGTLDATTMAVRSSGIIDAANQRLAQQGLRLPTSR